MFYMPLINPDKIGLSLITIFTVEIFVIAILLILIVVL